jgi:hypothetical protein
VKANVLFFDRRPAGEIPWTEKLWIYDLRTNKHFTLKTNPLKEADLEDFVCSYNPESRHDRTETERFRAFSYDELVKRDKASLDIFWLKDESLEDSRRSWRRRSWRAWRRRCRSSEPSMRSWGRGRWSIPVKKTAHKELYGHLFYTGSSGPCPQKLILAAWRNICRPGPLASLNYVD